MLVAAARLSLHNSMANIPDAEVYLGKLDDLPTPIATINRCVVHPDYRKRGLATTLDCVRIGAARDVGCPAVLCSVSDGRRLSQLLAIGFRAICEGSPYQSGPLTGSRPTIW